ncbi:type I-E CRISPR-associated protein Cas7/Cse4/CasC [Endozoicomonas acroporae]|uniref:type I-E CRISPR-associated protein Cas7/Cse4/CasC n=1 Tax=Endozoicomonas acroporae TaxID=1701104 RepID=UPI003D7AA7FB
MNKNFINFHILISHSPSCLNRDDMNMQKSAIFGGKRRVRVSSQSLKRAMRTSEYYQEHFPEVSIRTRQLELLAKKLTQLAPKIDEKWIAKSVELFSSKVIDDSDDDMESDEEITQKKTAVAPWSISEFKIFCELVQEIYESDLNEKDHASLVKAIEKEGKRKATAKKPRLSDDQVKDIILAKIVKRELKERTEIMVKACGRATDIALSGRMATSGLMTNVDGALAVAHSITTHAVDADIDWFTAVDDLQEMGSGHLDTQEFSSGVFYRYASLNLQQLQKNLGDASREQALEIAAHVLHMLATEVPSAKQQSFAAHNLADLALVSFSDQPLSLANAFESPVKETGNGFRRPSIKELHDHWQKLSVGFGLDDCCAEWVLEDVELPQGINAVESLTALKQWVQNNGEG